VTGPTGSGKTTTPVFRLNELNSPVTTSSRWKTRWSFKFPASPGAHEKEIAFPSPNALRSILRQDPDIIMIGEIRDTETAESPSKRAHRPIKCEHHAL